MRAALRAVFVAFSLVSTGILMTTSEISETVKGMRCRAISPSKEVAAEVLPGEEDEQERGHSLQSSDTGHERSCENSS